jgi:hypothetical protein
MSQLSVTAWFSPNLNHSANRLCNNCMHEHELCVDCHKTVHRWMLKEFAKYLRSKGINVKTTVDKEDPFHMWYCENCPSHYKSYHSIDSNEQLFQHLNDIHNIKVVDVTITKRRPAPEIIEFHLVIEFQVAEANASSLESTGL